MSNDFFFVLVGEGRGSVDDFFLVGSSTFQSKTNTHALVESNITDARRLHLSLL